MPKITISKEAFKAFSPEDQKNFKKKKDGDKTVYTGSVVLTQKFTDKTEEYDTLSKEFKELKEDKGVGLPKILADMKPDDLVAIVGKYQKLEKKLANGKLKSDDAINEKIETEVRSAIKEYQEKNQELSDKLERTTELLESTKKTAAIGSKMSDIKNKIALAKYVKLRPGLEKHLAAEIQKYLPDDPEDTFFVNPEPDEEGKKKRLWSQNDDALMGVDEFVDNFIEKTPGFFDPVKGESKDDDDDTDYGGKIDFDKATPEELIASGL